MTVEEGRNAIEANLSAFSESVGINYEAYQMDDGSVYYEFPTDAFAENGKVSCDNRIYVEEDKIVSISFLNMPLLVSGETEVMRLICKLNLRVGPVHFGINDERQIFAIYEVLREGEGAPSEEGVAGIVHLPYMAINNYAKYFLDAAYKKGTAEEILERHRKHLDKEVLA